MARIPKYPFRVLVTMLAGGRGENGPLLRQEWHNYETLPGAYGYREIALRKRATKKVEIVLVIDESTPSHSVGT